jgi:hypothetical protein
MFELRWVLEPLLESVDAVLGGRGLLPNAVRATGEFLLALLAVIAALFVVDLLGFPFAWPLVAAFIVFAGWVPWRYGFGKDVLTGRAVYDVKTATNPGYRALRLYLTILLTLQALLTLSAAFAVLTAALQERGLVTEQPPADVDGFVWSALGFYAWNLLDAIPLLEIPQTLNWEQATTLRDHLGGALLLAYKLLVIVPLVGLIVGLVTVLRTPRPID